MDHPLTQRFQSSAGELAWDAAMVSPTGPVAGGAGFQGALTVVFALLALTVLRILPVQASLLGTGLRPVTTTFLGWFGPRGLASILFVLLIIEESELPGEALISTVVVVTVALSVILHGITAGPAARRYGAMAGRLGDSAENVTVADEAFPTEPKP